MDQFRLAFDVPRDPEEPLRFRGVAYSGDLVPDFGWQGDTAVDLGAMETPDGAELPVLVDHSWSVTAIAGKGRIRRTTDEAGAMSLTIEGEVTEATDAGRQIAALMRAGHPMQLSIGMTGKAEEARGPIQINGRTLNARTVLRSPLIREVSFVAVGADPRTTAARLSAVRPQQEPRPTMTRTAEDQTLIDTLTGKVAALSAQVDTLTAAAEAAAKGRRAAEMAALFSEIGRPMPEGDQFAGWAGMSDAAFAAAASALRDAAPRLDRALFTAQSPARAASAAAAEPANRGALLMAAVDAIAKPAR